MDKPISMLVNDFKRDLIKLVNESGIPIIILEYIIRDLHTEISNLSQQKAQEELSEYFKSLRENTEKETEGGNT